MDNILKINEKEYKVNTGLKAMFIWESMNDKPFKIETMFDQFVYLYCSILAGNNEDELQFEDFIEYCEEHQEIMGEFLEILNKKIKLKDTLSGSDGKKKGTKKGAVKPKN